MADKLYGPYGYMVGTIGSSEDEWSFRNDPSMDAEDFSEPLFAKRELLATRGRSMGTGEGLPRGSASAAEIKHAMATWRADFENAPRNGRSIIGVCPNLPGMVWLEWCKINGVEGWYWGEKLCHPTAYFVVPVPDAEPGAGAASALPSPLPSQGEPVADAREHDVWISPYALNCLQTEFKGGYNVRGVIDRLPDDVPLVPAEALAAAEARADRAAKDAQVEIDNLRDELACTYEELVEHTGDSLDDARTKRIEELRRTILKETPRGER